MLAKFPFPPVAQFLRGKREREREKNGAIAESLLTYPLCCQSFADVWSRIVSRKFRPRLSPRTENCVECE